MLVTRFFGSDGVGQVTDFMPLAEEGRPGHQWLVRRVSVTRGSVRFRLDCRPAFDYARVKHEVQVKDGAVRFHAKSAALELAGAGRVGKTSLLPCADRRRSASRLTPRLLRCPPTRLWRCSTR